MLRYLGIFFLLSIFLLTLTIIFSSSLQTAMAKESEITIKNANVDEKDKLVVVSKINIENITNIGMIKVVGAINGEEFVKNIPLDSIDKTTKKLKVNFVMNKDNEFVSAGKPDEFFVCAYHYTNANNNNNDNNPTLISFEQKDAIKYFDCNEGDIKSTSFPTEANLFKAKSQVYNQKKFTFIT